HNYFSFLDKLTAFLISFRDRDGQYIRIPPRKMQAPINPKITILPIKIPIDSAISQAGTSSIPTRKNIIIGEKNGINELIVINVASGTFKPNIAMKNPIIIKINIGINNCCKSSTRLTSEPNIAAIVAYNK